MQTLRTIPIAVPKDAWAFTGPERAPMSRLMAQLEINGCPLHLEAYQVTTTRRDVPNIQMAEDPEFDDVLEHLQRAVYGDGPWQTVELFDREYILVATPYR
jgi:hypothetical protein